MSTTTSRNEAAAERPTTSVRMSAELVTALTEAGWAFGDPGPDGFYTPVVYTGALAAERAAAWSRADAALAVYGYDKAAVIWHDLRRAILDEDADRG